MQKVCPDICKFRIRPATRSVVATCYMRNLCSITHHHCWSYFMVTLSWAYLALRQRRQLPPHFLNKINNVYLELRYQAVSHSALLTACILLLMKINQLYFSPRTLREDVYIPPQSLNRRYAPGYINKLNRIELLLSDAGPSCHCIQVLKLSSTRLVPAQKEVWWVSCPPLPPPVGQSIKPSLNYISY